MFWSDSIDDPSGDDQICDSGIDSKFLFFDDSDVSWLEEDEVEDEQDAPDEDDEWGLSAVK